MTYQPYEPPVNQAGAPAGAGIMQTAKFGMWGLIATGAGILLALVGFGFISWVANIAGLVLAIMSLVKKEYPKWPAWVTIGLNIAGLVLILFLFLIVGGLFLTLAGTM